MFSPPLQYLVPIFQRGYVWTVDKQIGTLWANIADRADDFERYQALLINARATGSAHMVKPPRKHFLGTVITTPHQAAIPGEPETTEVIDGQQRITTMQLLALAFRDCIADVEDQFLRKSLHIYTRNEASYREPHYHYKVWPTNAGRDELRTLIEAGSLAKVCEAFPITFIGKGKSKKRTQRTLMVEAYLYFVGVISMYLRGTAFDEISPPQSELEQLLVDDDIRTDVTWTDRWVHAIRHEQAPTPPFSELPLQTERIAPLLSTLNDYLQLIELRLDNDDDAQVIFETLNALGEKLTPADLIRNFVFLQATRRSLPVDDLYTQYWRQFDETPAEPSAGGKKPFWKVEERQGRLKSARLDTLLYHYVSMRTRDDIKLEHVFEAFKQWWISSDRKLDMELSALKAASSLFHNLILPDRTMRLGRFAHNIRVLDSSTAMPVVLLLGERLGTDSKDFLDCLTILESYLVRRAICALTTKAYNRVFPGLVRRLSESKESAVTTTIDYLNGLAGGITQEWPSDVAFEKAWTTTPTYRVLRPARTRMVLEALELGLRNSTHHESPHLPLEKLHVEHVLPQAWQTHWPALPDDPAVLAARETMLHNIGNLTLLTEKLNPTLSNSSFAVKRPEITKSLLALNAYFQAPEWLLPESKWNETTIAARADSLFAAALQIWPHPSSAA
jgi:hypothetical protein